MEMEDICPKCKTETIYTNKKDVYCVSKNCFWSFPVEAWFHYVEVNQ